MTDNEILELFETTNITLAELSLKTGRSIQILKRLIMNAPAPKLFKDGVEIPLDCPQSVYRGGTLVHKRRGEL